MNYTTYIMGANALFNKTIMNPRLSDGTYLWHIYESNWRILHIDSFEPGYWTVPGVHYKITLARSER